MTEVQMEAVVRVIALIAGTAPFLASVILDSSGVLQGGSAVWGLAVVVLCSVKIKEKI